MNAVADQQVVKEEYKNTVYIENKIKSGGDLLNPNANYIPQEVVEENFPRHVVLNKEKYKEFLIL